MSFKFPAVTDFRQFRSANSDSVLPVTLNETLIERMLIQILERMIKGGKTSPPLRDVETSSIEPVGPYAYPNVLLGKLASSPNMQGFDSDRGIEVLDGWLRTCIVEVINQGKGRQREKLDYFRLLSIASYRSGLPNSDGRARHRRVDELVYNSLILALSDTVPSGVNIQKTLRSRLTNSVISRGVDFPDVKEPWINPGYNLKDEVDINALLELNLLELIDGKNPASTSAQTPGSMAAGSSFLFPQGILPIGRDFLQVLSQFDSNSVPEVVSSLESVLAIRLFQLPIRTAHNLRQLLSGSPVNDFGKLSDNSIEMYCDFTGETSSSSWRLAKLSVQNHMKMLVNYFRDAILLREVERAFSQSKTWKDEYFASNGDEKLKLLIEATKSTELEGYIYPTIERIKGFLEQNQLDEELKNFEDLANVNDNWSELLVSLIVEDRSVRATDGYRKWMYSVGGLTQSGPRRVSLLKGTMGAAQTWGYSLSDEVLVTCLQLCFFDERGLREGGANSKLEMAVILKRLRNRFGILINAVPAGLLTPEFQSAASKNYEAFKRKLKQLGCFEGLSDDFEAQYISFPSDRGKQS